MFDLGNTLGTLIGAFGGGVGIFVGIRSLGYQKRQTIIMEKTIRDDPKIQSEIQAQVDRQFDFDPEATGTAVKRTQNRLRTLVTQVNKIDKTQQESVPRISNIEDQLKHLSTSSQSHDIQLRQLSESSQLPEIRQAMARIDDLKLKEVFAMMGSIHEVRRLAAETQEAKDAVELWKQAIEDWKNEIEEINGRLISELGRYGSDIDQIRRQVDNFDADEMAQLVMRQIAAKLQA